MPRRSQPHDATLEATRREAGGCRRCDVWRDATQVVFGEGPAPARVMLVGEQPGDVEDRRGAPFVGPAGGLLRCVLAEVGLADEDVYVTNAVKHFKWRPKGTRRIRIGGPWPAWCGVRAPRVGTPDGRRARALSARRR